MKFIPHTYESTQCALHSPLPPPVLVDLWVERDGPGDEVDPTDDVADDVEGLVLRHGHEDEGVSSAEEQASNGQTERWLIQVPL